MLKFDLPPFAIAALGFVSSTLVLPASAADVTWTGATDLLYGTPTNWSTGAVPIAGDNAIINNGGTAQIVPDDAFAANSLSLANGGLSQSGGSFIATGNTRIGNLAGTVNFTQTDGSFVSNARLYFADGNGASSVLSTVTGSIGGTVSAADYLVVGRQGGTATLTVTGSLDKIGTINRFIVGDGGFGTGTISIEGTGNVSSTTGFDIGNGNGAVGTVTAKGGSTLTSGINGGNGANTQMVVGGGNNGGNGSTGTGTLNIQDSAEVSSNLAEFWVGNGAGSTGVVNMSGGTLKVGNWVAIGRTGSGTLNLSGGVITKTGVGNFILNGSTGTLTQTGGEIDVQSGQTWLSEGAGRNSVWNASAGTANLGTITRIGYGGSATMTISGTANYTNGTVYVSSNGGSVGALNLDGGTFTANHVEEGAGTGTISFNGGVLKAGADDANFIQDFEAGDLDVKAGGAKIDTAGHVVATNAQFTGVGGLTKQGEGMLTLSGASLYEGATVVQAGALVVATGGSLDFSTALSVANGASLELQSDISLNDEIHLFVVTGSDVSLSFTGEETIGSLAFNGNFVAVDTYTADELNTLFGQNIFSGDGSLVVTSAVPEPATVALLLGGALVLGAYRLRSRRAAR